MAVLETNNKYKQENNIALQAYNFRAEIFQPPHNKHLQLKKGKNFGLALFDRRIRRVVEPGVFQVTVGGLTGSFQVTGTAVEQEER